MTPTLTAEGRESELSGRPTPRLITRSASGAIIQECLLQFIPLRAIRPLNNAMIRRAEK